MKNRTLSVLAIVVAMLAMFTFFAAGDSSPGMANDQTVQTMVTLAPLVYTQAEVAVASLPQNDFTLYPSVTNTARFANVTERVRYAELVKAGEILTESNRPTSLATLPGGGRDHQYIKDSRSIRSDHRQRILLC